MGGLHKGLAILDAVLNDKEFEQRGVKYSFVGFSIASATDDFEFPENRFVIGKTAKLRQTHVGEKIPGDIVEYEADDWIPLITIFDLVDQYIFIQKDYRFGTDTQIANAVATGLRPSVLAKYNHRIFIEPKTRIEDFWNVIEKYNKVYKLNLHLISPNILETNKKARESLKSLKELFGQDEVKITLESESGQLHLPQEPIGDYLDYIAEGEGSWKLKTDGERGGTKWHSSEKATETFELSVPEEYEIENDKQLELETGEPSPGRARSDSRMISQVYSKILRGLKR